MDQLNLVALTGILERAATLLGSNGQSQGRFTLRVDELSKDMQVFKVYVPCEAYGRVAERAGSWEVGALLAIEGRLKWRSYTDAHGAKKSELCVFAKEVRVLVPLAVPVGHEH